MFYIFFFLNLASAQPSSPLNEWIERPDLVQNLERLLPGNEINAREYRAFEDGVRGLGYVPEAGPRLWLDLKEISDDDCVEDRRAPQGSICRTETAPYRLETIFVKDGRRFYLVSEGKAEFHKSGQRRLKAVIPKRQGVDRERRHLIPEMPDN